MRWSKLTLRCLWTDSALSVLKRIEFSRILTCWSRLNSGKEAKVHFNRHCCCLVLMLSSSSSSQETWQRRHGGPFPEFTTLPREAVGWAVVVGVVLGKTPDVPMEKMFDDGGFRWRLGTIQSAISRQHLDDDIPSTYLGWKKPSRCCGFMLALEDGKGGMRM